MSEADHVTRIVERLRKDHPDPAIRAQLYESADKWQAYVDVLMNGQDADATTLARIASAVRAAEDGEAHH
ncbi:hypothetical protein BH11MYX2_BH11MYX2_02030 [soil metagenome]